MAIKLITGLKSAADIESKDDGARIYGTISAGDRVLNVGNKWAYQIISNNSVRVKDGELLMQGRHVRQTPDTYADLTINNGTQGLKRNDIIVARYTKNSGTSLENVELAVVEGTPGATATDPTLTTGDIFAGCESHEMALYRVSLDGLNISSVTALFVELSSLEDHVQSLSKGGTGATTASNARTNLELYKGFSLYDNASGTQSTITLSDSAANYDYMEIYLKTITPTYGMFRVYSPNGKDAVMWNCFVDGTQVLWHYARLVISGTSITWGAQATARAPIGGAIATNSTLMLYVVKIVGYKY